MTKKKLAMKKKLVMKKELVMEEHASDYEEKINNKDTYDQSDDGIENMTYDQSNQDNYTENYPLESKACAGH